MDICVVQGRNVAENWKLGEAFATSQTLMTTFLMDESAVAALFSLQTPAANQQPCLRPQFKNLHGLKQRFLVDCMAISHNFDTQRIWNPSPI